MHDGQPTKPKAFYSPSLLAQVLNALGAVLGVVLSIVVSIQLKLPSPMFYVVCIPAVVFFALSGWYAYGFKILISPQAPDVTVLGQFYGMTLWKRTYAIQDVRRFDLRYDGDGCPFITLEFSGGHSYSIVTARTEGTFGELRKTFDPAGYLSLPAPGTRRRLARF